MNKNTYNLISKFECCGKAMVTVIIEDRVACIMPEIEYNRIVEAERKLKKNNRFKKSA